MLFQKTSFYLSTGHIMRTSSINNIHLNAIWGQPHPDQQPKLLEQFSKTTTTLTQIFDSCKVNAHYYEPRKHLPESRFTIIAEFNGAPRFSYSGDQRQYHTELLNECIKKFHYLLNSQFQISAEVFDYIRRITPAEWKELAKKLKKSPPVTDELVCIFKKRSPIKILDLPIGL
jgi:hypothetical protein